AASSQKMNSGTLSSRTATWKEPGARRARSQAARVAAAATTSPWVRVRSPAMSPGRGSSARASTAWAIVSGCSIASPNRADLGRNPHYWNTLHFSPGRVTFAGSRRIGPRRRTGGRAHPMEFGIFNAACLLPKYRAKHGDAAEHDRIMDEVAFIVAADKAGFKYTWASEHHFLTDYSHLSASE